MCDRLRCLRRVGCRVRRRPAASRRIRPDDVYADVAEVVDLLDDAPEVADSVAASIGVPTSRLCGAVCERGGDLPHIFPRFFEDMAAVDDGEVAVRRELRTTLTERSQARDVLLRTKGAIRVG